MVFKITKFINTFKQGISNKFDDVVKCRENKINMMRKDLYIYCKLNAEKSYVDYRQVVN